MCNNLVEILRQLRSSGPNGFEGLVAALLERLTGVHFNLAISGSQMGRDMSSSRLYANVVAVECKRYGADTELSERELLAELLQATHSIPDLDVWILVASREIPSQLEENLRQQAEQRGVHYLSISSSDGTPSSIDVICAYAADLFKQHEVVQKLVKADVVNRLITQVTNHPQFQQQVDTLKAAFSSALVGFENWRKEQNKWFIDCVSSAQKSRAKFGQPINVASADVKLIERVAEWNLMSQWFGTWKDSHKLLAILGEEGDGKTWSISSWLWKRIRDDGTFPAVIFLASTEFNAEDPGVLLRQTISRRLSMIPEERIRLRVDRWMKRPNQDAPLILLVLDGVNERGKPESWRKLLEQLVGDPSYSHVAVIVTCRTTHWQSHFAPLRHLSASTITIPPYDDCELDIALSQNNLSRQDIQSNLLPLIRKPRYFDLTIKLRNKVSVSGDVTIARLIYEDWRDRFERKQNLPLTDEDF